MIELLFKKKYSVILFNVGLIAISIGIFLGFSYLAGEAVINYIFAGIFWVTGRHFYTRIGRILNANETDDE